MKKIIPLLTITSIWLIGCGGDDSSDNFIGTWVADNITISNCATESQNGSDALSCNEAFCYKLILNGDKTYSFQRGLPTQTGMWSVGDYLSLCIDDDEEEEPICEKFLVQFTGASMILIADSTSTGCISSYFFNLQVSTDDTQ